MGDKQETIADILADMRSLVKPGETLNNTYELLNGLADRIEAAQKMEVGNGAKMLSALKAIVDVFDSKEPMSQQERELVVYNLAKNALSAPSRNCDRFNTFEDALAGWREVSPDESGPFDNWLFAEAKGESK